MSTKMPEGESPLMTTTEVAIYWRVHPISVQRWASRFGWRRVLDPGGRVRFYKEDVLRQEVSPTVRVNRGQFRKTA